MTIYDQHSLNMAFQKKQLVLANIAIFDHEASRGLHMRFWRQHAFESKMSNFSFQKKHFLQGEAQNQYRKNAFNVTHSDSER